MYISEIFITLLRKKEVMYLNDISTQSKGKNLMQVFTNLCIKIVLFLGVKS